MRPSKYSVHIPFQHDMGSISPYTVSAKYLYGSAREEALWHYNSMRRHDGLPERKHLPKGTQFQPIYE